MTSPYDTYTSPLATRNASPEMLRLWSARHKFNSWRRIWLAVAEAMCEMGGAPSASSGSERAQSASDGSASDARGGSQAQGGSGGPFAHALGSSGQGDTSSARAEGSLRVLVTREQVEELRAVVERTNPDGTVGITDEEIRLAEKYERELRHDVMAHVHALGDACPKARPIIHLGMTSQDVVCNADLMTVKAAFELVEKKIDRLQHALGEVADQWKSLPSLGFTHYQPAQPVTVGRRIAQWAYEVGLARDDLRLGNDLKGLRGATGTQASYLALFEGDTRQVDLLEADVVSRLVFCKSVYEWSAENHRIEIDRLRRVCAAWRNSDDRDRLERDTAKLAAVESSTERDWLDRHLSMPSLRTFWLTSQTYPRVVDCLALSNLASVAAVLHKIATDIRLLSNRKELDEPFEDKQIGSSAMPYKRNPMRCERICGLTRFVMNLVGNAYDTAATQWLERTLDDSSNRRLSLPEAFLALDGALDLMHNVASGLIVHEAMVRKNLMAELPFMATENILMACVRAGGDRQEYHEKIRVHAQAAGWRVKHEGLDNDLLERLKGDRAFWSKARGGPLEVELDWSEGPGGLLDPMRYVGRSVEQTERFIRDVVEPLREQYKDAIEGLGESGPRV